MHNLKIIRVRLGLTQQALATALGCSQANVYLYEKGQAVPSEAARKLIQVATGLGLPITFDHVYSDVALPDFAFPELEPGKAPSCDAKYPIAVVSCGHHGKRVADE